MTGVGCDHRALVSTLRRIPEHIGPQIRWRAVVVALLGSMTWQRNRNDKFCSGSRARAVTFAFNCSPNELTIRMPSPLASRRSKSAGSPAPSSRTETERIVAYPSNADPNLPTRLTLVRVLGSVCYQFIDNQCRRNGSIGCDLDPFFYISMNVASRDTRIQIFADCFDIPAYIHALEV